METRLNKIENEYKELNESLLHPDIITDFKKTNEILKKIKSLEKIVNLYHDLKKTRSEIEDLKELLKTENDEEMIEFIKKDLEEKIDIEKTLLDDLKIALLPKDPNDEKNVIFEIRGAAGGDEANIFAGDLFRMYTKYALLKNWSVEVVDSNEGSVGGYSYIEFIISGENVYSTMKYESGSHRVQRVPVTESNGRLQTSTATVLVVCEADEIDVEVKAEDLRIDTFCSSGHGGQSVNTTKSAVRVTHIPTGLVASCQDGKSQHDNKANAIKILKARIYDQIIAEKEEKEGKIRLSKVGRGNRSEKIRTYNYPQNRVTDHRINFTVMALDRVMEGDIEPITNQLALYNQEVLLKGENNE